MKVLNNYSDYRYERKYVIEHTSLQKVFNYIKGSSENPPRQKLEKLYIPSGNIYIVKRDILIKKKTLIGRKQTFYVINKKDYVNIDGDDDLILAKVKLKKFK